MNSFQTNIIRQLIDNGGIIAYPTESSFGFGCNPHDAQAVYRILDIKQRPVHKGVILVASSVEQLQDWVQKPPHKVWQRVCKTWPGPYNWVLPAAKTAPAWITGGRNSIAVRVSQHPVVVEICQALNHPIVSTSANVGGRKPLTDSLQVQKQFGSQLDYIVPGKSGGLSACPIIDAHSLEKLRR